MRSPTKVSALDSQHVEHVAAGNWHSTAIDSEGKCWQWGTGWKGTFGIQGQHFFSYPVENTQVSELCATMLSDGVRVSKLKSVNNCTMVMFDNGEVYGWGNNEEGILANNHIRGIFSRLGTIKICQIEYIFATGYYAPTKIHGSYTGKVVDFDISTNLFVMMTGTVPQIPRIKIFRRWTGLLCWL